MSLIQDARKAARDKLAEHVEGVKYALARVSVAAYKYNYGALEAAADSLAEHVDSDGAWSLTVRKEEEFMGQDEAAQGVSVAPDANARSSTCGWCWHYMDASTVPQARCPQVGGRVSGKQRGCDKWHDRRGPCENKTCKVCGNAEARASGDGKTCGECMAWAPHRVPNCALAEHGEETSKTSPACRAFEAQGEPYDEGDGKAWTGLGISAACDCCIHAQQQGVCAVDLEETQKECSRTRRLPRCCADCPDRAADKCTPERGDLCSKRARYLRRDIGTAPGNTCGECERWCRAVSIPHCALSVHGKQTSAASPACAYFEAKPSSTDKRCCQCYRYRDPEQCQEVKATDPACDDFAPQHWVRDGKLYVCTDRDLLETWEPAPEPLTWQEGHPPDDARRVYLRTIDGSWTVWDREGEESLKSLLYLESLMTAYPRLVTHWCPAPEPHLPKGTRDWVGLAGACKEE